MKKLPNDIVLRPRFQLEIFEKKTVLLKRFLTSKKEPFIINCLDDHVFIKYKKEKTHFWSPQLHLEIDETGAKSVKIYGFFGPNPTLWTLFMFLHLIVATLFIIFGIWAYVNNSLNKPYGLQIGFMVLLVILWVSLYIFGRIGKKKGKPQISELYGYMMEILSQEK